MKSALEGEILMNKRAVDGTRFCEMAKDSSVANDVKCISWNLESIISNEEEFKVMRIDRMQPDLMSSKSTFGREPRPHYLRNDIVSLVLKALRAKKAKKNFTQKTRDGNRGASAKSLLRAHGIDSAP